MYCPSMCLSFERLRCFVAGNGGGGGGDDDDREIAGEALDLDPNCLSLMGNLKRREAVKGA